MKIKQLLIFLALFGVLGGVAWYKNATGQTRAAGSRLMGTEVFAGVPFDQVSDILVQQGEERQQLVKQGGTWVITSMGGYPVDFALLKRHLMALSQLKVGQVVQSGDLADFGLMDDQTLHITLTDVEDEMLARVSFGDTRKGGVGRYVKMDNGAVVLINEALSSFPTKDTGWVEPQLLHVNATDLRSIESTVSKVTTKVMVGPNNTYMVEGLPAGKQVDTAKAGQLARAIQYLNFDDVAKSGESDALRGLAEPIRWVGETQAGVLYTLLVSTNDVQGGAWVKVAAEYNPPTEAARGEEVDDAAWAATQAAHTARVEAAKKVVEEISQMAGWTYRIASHNGSNFRVDVAKLLVDIPKPETTPPAPEGPDLQRAAQQAVQAISAVVPATKKPAAKVVTEPIMVGE